MIELTDVTRTYVMGEETIYALRDVTLAVADGEFVSFVGSSGSGKSTLMHIIGGLDSPTSGRIVVDGEDLSRASDRALSRYRNRRVGFVFQAFNLQPYLTALENVMLPLVFAGVPLAERRERAADALAEVGLAERVRHRPTQLSGGERQRVAIARALVNHPSTLLADEPTGNLDTTTGRRIVELLARVNEERGTTLLLVTHDLEVASHAGRRFRLRDGRLYPAEEEA